MVTTQMAAPQPMVKPDFYGVVNGEEIQVILPQASEEYGPISHYFLVVVPDDKLNTDKHPDQFLTDVVSCVSCIFDFMFLVLFWLVDWVVDLPERGLRYFWYNFGCC